MLNIQSMSTAELVTYKLELEKSNSSEELSQVLEELEMRSITGDSFEKESVSDDFEANVVSSTESTSSSNGINKEVDGTYQSILADEAILAEYDKQYQDLLAQERDIEKICDDFEFPDLEKVTSSSQANKIIESVEQQIQRLEQLIQLAEQAIAVLEQEKQVAEQQLAQREAEQAQLEANIEQIKQQMEYNEAKANSLADEAESNLESQVQRFIAEYQSGNMEEEGVDLQEFLEGKMSNISLPDSIKTLFSQNEMLLEQLNIKSQQLSLVQTAISNLNSKITYLDGQIGAQNQKLEKYNAHLERANQYKDGAVQVRDAWKKAEAAKRKKKKHGLGGFIKRAINAAKSAVKKIAKTVARGWNNLWQETCKGLGKLVDNVCGAVGTVVDKAGWDGMGNGIRSIGETVEGVVNVVGGALSGDKEELQRAYDSIEEHWESAASTVIRTAIMAQVASIPYVGIVAAAALSRDEVAEPVGEFVGDALDEVLNAGGSLLDHRLGLDGLGNSFRALGETAEGALDYVTGNAVNDKEMAHKGWERIEDNGIQSLSAVATIATIWCGGWGGAAFNSLFGSTIMSTTGSVIATKVIATAADLVIQEYINRYGSDEVGWAKAITDSFFATFGSVLGFTADIDEMARNMGLATAEDWAKYNEMLAEVKKIQEKMEAAMKNMTPMQQKIFLAKTWLIEQIKSLPETVLSNADTYGENLYDWFHNDKKNNQQNNAVNANGAAQNNQQGADNEAIKQMTEIIQQNIDATIEAAIKENPELAASPEKVQGLKEMLQTAAMEMFAEPPEFSEEDIAEILAALQEAAKNQA